MFVSESVLLSHYVHNEEFSTAKKKINDYPLLSSFVVQVQVYQVILKVMICCPLLNRSFQK